MHPGVKEQLVDTTPFTTGVIGLPSRTVGQSWSVMKKTTFRTTSLSPDHTGSAIAMLAVFVHEIFLSTASVRGFRIFNVVGMNIPLSSLMRSKCVSFIMLIWAPVLRTKGSVVVPAYVTLYAFVAALLSLLPFLLEHCLLLLWRKFLTIMHFF